MNSFAFRKFKNEIGQANHFLITILVGLDAVEDGATKKDTFKASWNPKDVSSSVVRSRNFAIKSALAWTVDNLDMYLRLCNRKPKLLSESESEEFSHTNHSVYNKYKCIIKNHPELEINKKAFVDLLICWRNNSVHFEAENQLSEDSKKYFDNDAKDDKELEKYNFEVGPMMDRFERGNSPSFKETATLINMTIRFVEQLDELLFKRVPQESYLDDIICANIKSDDKMYEMFGYNSADVSRRVKQIKQYLVTKGITDDFINEDGEQFIQHIAGLKKDELKEGLKKHTFRDGM